MSITPYNNYRVYDLSNVLQPYISSTAEFGYFGNLGNITNSNWYSMPTNLITNNGIATVDASGLHILSAGVYKLNLSVDASNCGAPSANNTIYFNFGTVHLSNASSPTGSFGGNHNVGMYSFGSTATTYPGIISWTANAYCTTNSGSGFGLPNQDLCYNYKSAANSSAQIYPGICTTQITFILNQATTIFFNVGCLSDAQSTGLEGSNLKMGKSYFTLQLITNTPPRNVIWTQQTSPGYKSWTSIASDSTGKYLAATTTYGTATGDIYTSTNYGVNWTPRASTTNWYSIASSSDGSRLAAVVYGGYIWTSDSSGVSWTTNSNSSGSRNWRSIASSSNGIKLAAVESPGYIWTSDNSGNSWTSCLTDASRNWYSIASSSDGVNLAAVVNGGYIYTSTDASHNTWTQQTLSGSRNWYSIASDSTGQYLAAVVYGGGIWTSTDSGVNWTPRATNRNWKCITSDSTGQYLAAIVYGEYIYTSSDYGTNWTPCATDADRHWQAIASSSSGAYLAAAVSNENMYTGIKSY